jgi:septal ring factor EnvC (AmiA/AmiB activator)
LHEGSGGAREFGGEVSAWLSAWAALGADARTPTGTVIKHLVSLVLELKEQQMALKDVVTAMQKEQADLVARVASQQGVVASVKTLLQGQAAQIAALKAQIQELIDAGTADQASLDALTQVVASLDAQEKAFGAQQQELADAVAANNTVQG